MSRRLLRTSIPVVLAFVFAFAFVAQGSSAMSVAHAAAPVYTSHMIVQLRQHQGGVIRVAKAATLSGRVAPSPSTITPDTFYQCLNHVNYTLIQDDTNNFTIYGDTTNNCGENATYDKVVWSISSFCGSNGVVYWPYQYTSVGFIEDAYTAYWDQGFGLSCTVCKYTNGQLTGQDYPPINVSTNSWDQSAANSGRDQLSSNTVYQGTQLRNSPNYSVYCPPTQ